MQVAARKAHAMMMAKRQAVWRNAVECMMRKGELPMSVRSALQDAAVRRELAEKAARRAAQRRQRRPERGRVVGESAGGPDGGGAGVPLQQAGRRWPAGGLAPGRSPPPPPLPHPLPSLLRPSPPPPPPLRGAGRGAEASLQSQSGLAGAQPSPPFSNAHQEARCGLLGSAVGGLGGEAGELGGGAGGGRGEAGAMDDMQWREARWGVPGRFEGEDGDEGAASYMLSCDRRDDDVTEDPDGLSFVGSGAGSGAPG